MNLLKVKFTESDKNGLLEYQLKKESWKQLTHLCSPAIQQRAFTVNINGGDAIFILNSAGTVFDMEFNVPRSAWKVTELNHENKDKQKYNLNFDTNSFASRNLEIDMPVTAVTNEEISVVHFLFGNCSDFHSVRISLSNEVIALVRENKLFGFEVSIPIENRLDNPLLKRQKR